RVWTVRQFDLQLAAIPAVALLTALTFALTPLTFARASARRPGAIERSLLVLMFLGAISIPLYHSMPGGSFLLVWPLTLIALNLIVAIVAPDRVVLRT